MLRQCLGLFRCNSAGPGALARAQGAGGGVVQGLTKRLQMLAKGGRAALPPACAALRSPLIWLHCDNARGTQRLAALSEILLQEGEGLSVLVSHPAGMEPLPELPGRIELALEPDDAGFAHALAAQLPPAAFLSTARRIPGGMISALSSCGTVICLADMAVPRLASGWGRLPGHRRSVLRRVDHVFLPHDAILSDWSGYGMREEVLMRAGRLSVTPAALGCNEAEREALAEAFRHRTMWFATHVPEREEEMVIAAHGEALRDSHRLVLLLHPADLQRGAALKAALRSRFSTALRSEDDLVTPETQVYIVDTESERGLWYRLAVACYIGGSLGGDGALVSPMEAAGLGCAIVHGRMFGRHAEAFDLLRQARATRMVQGPEALGPAIGGALRPEQAADMANRGWQVIAEGAEATEAVLSTLVTACKPQAEG